MIDLPDVHAKQPITAGLWNRTMAALRRACNLSVAGGLEMSQGPGGTIIILPNQLQRPFWRATVAGGSGSVDQSITSSDTSSPDTVTFDHQDDNVTTLADIWSLAGSQLAIGKVGRVRSTVQCTAYFNDPSSLRSGSMAMWHQYQSPSGGSWIDVGNSGLINSQVTEAYGLYYMTFKFSAEQYIEAGTKLKIVAVYANGTAASPTIVSGNNGPYFTYDGTSLPVFGPSWTVEFLD